jgi:hypothetical protein
LKRVKKSTLSPEWKAVLRKSARDEVAVEKWQAARQAWEENGRQGEPPSPPWATTNWTALSADPAGRQTLRALAAHLGTNDDSVAELRDLLRCAAMAAERFERRGGRASRGLFTPIREVLLVLADCIRVRFDGLSPDEEAKALAEGWRPSEEGIQINLLEALHGPARKLLAKPSTESLRLDARRTGVRFANPQTGRVQKSATGRELVAVLERLIREMGLRGDELAKAIAGEQLWIRGAFPQFENIRWPYRGHPSEYESPRARLHSWCASERINFDRTSDFEGLAVHLLRALGLTERQAWNAVNAAEDMKTKRRAKRP